MGYDELGHWLLGGYFVSSGILHFLSFSEVSQKMAARGVPAAGFFLMLASAFQILMGLAFILRFHSFWAAMGLIAFIVAASFLMLNFWSMKEKAREDAISSWLVNLAIIGGLLGTGV
ncbi:DoxX family protein [Achromobacter xylosoxidans]|uniref:DoxX family protein n=1 Tax=Achromobacter TaxID=222 RepID=UPI0008A5B294|nr:MULTISPECIES: DoxX family protein [Achromobacter]MCH4579991.1 DoxX family protein [Achromobacter xylosoxidans]OFU72931.1 hypothetical protein HMPREF3137_18830 [Achromobacter xylosoxidans]PWY42814.1 DoxX family protein [Achromobacter sp. RW408]